MTTHFETEGLSNVEIPPPSTAVSLSQLIDSLDLFRLVQAGHEAVSSKHEGEGPHRPHSKEAQTAVYNRLRIRPNTCNTAKNLLCRVSRDTEQA